MLLKSIQRELSQTNSERVVWFFMALAPFAVAAVLATVWSKWTHLETLRQSVEAKRFESSSSVVVGRAIYLGSPHRLLPSASAMQASLEILTGIAAKNDVLLALGAYEHAIPFGAAMFRRSIELETYSSYEGIRGFLAQVALEIPSGSFSQIELHLDEGGEGKVRGKLRADLYYRAN